MNETEAKRNADAKLTGAGWSQPSPSHCQVSLAGRLYLVPTEVLRILDRHFKVDRLERTGGFDGDVCALRPEAKEHLIHAIGTAPREHVSDPRRVDAEVWIRAAARALDARASQSASPDVDAARLNAEAADKRLHAARVERQAAQLRCRAAGVSEVVTSE